MSHVFAPGQLGTLTLPNRLIHSATFECMAADDGSVTDQLIKRYETLAKGEVGLIIPGYLYVHPRGKAFPKQTGISDDGHLPGLTRLVEAVHQAGGRIALQIAHGGRQSPKKLIGQAPLAPSRFGRDPVSLNKPAAEMIKPALGNVPLILVGGVRRLSEMEEVLAAKKADFISMSRPFVREPFLAQRLQSGKSEAAACISCNKCFAAVFNGLPLRCYVNGLPRG